MYLLAQIGLGTEFSKLAQLGLGVAAFVLLAWIIRYVTTKTIPNIIDGAVTPSRGGDREKDTVITNSEYWIAPEITVAKADKSKLRAFGRNWNFAGRSAEICKLDWRGP